MNNYIKSALSQIKAEDELILKTEKSIRNILEQQKKRTTLFSIKKLAFVACAVILVLGMSIGGYAIYKTPVSYLSIDINPSVELGVNVFNNVVFAMSYNNDGKTILKGQNIVNSNVKDAVNKLVESASKKGFIASDGSTIVSVTSETNNASTASNLASDAKQGVNDAIKATGTTAVVYNDNIALDRRDAARRLDISPGKLNLIQKLQSLDPKITVDEYKDAKVTDIMDKVVALQKDVNTAEPESTNTNSDDSSSSISPNKPVVPDPDTQNIEKAVKQSQDNINNNCDANKNNKDRNNPPAVNPTGINPPSSRPTDNNPPNNKPTGVNPPVNNPPAIKPPVNNQPVIKQSVDNAPIINSTDVKPPIINPPLSDIKPPVNNPPDVNPIDKNYIAKTDSGIN